MTRKPNINSESEKELVKVEEQFNEFAKNIDEMTLDRMNQAPKQDIEPQTKISERDLAKKKDVYLKPHRVISCQDKFNEDYREQYNFDKEYVHFIAENKEIIGEALDVWTRPYGGLPAEWWKVPVNTPVWGPRYLAEQIKSAYYHRLIMKENVYTGSEGPAQFYGSMAADTTVQRLDAVPVSSRRSVFMGSTTF